MRATVLRPRVVWLVALVLVALTLAASAQARDEEDARSWKRKEAPDPDIANRPIPGPKTQERHANALEHLFEERYAEARQELDKLYFKRLNPVEQAMIHQDYAFIASAEENREEARRRFQLAIDTGGLYEQVKDVKFKIAMLWMQDEEWKHASDTLEEWFTMEPDPNSSSYYILALNYYQQEEFDKALVPAQKAVDISDAPKESWLQLLLGVHLLKKDYEAAIPVIQQLLALYPSRNYFMNLSTVYGALGNYEEAAIPLQLAYEQGLLTEDDHLRRLGQLLLFLNLPYRAAGVLDDGLDREVIAPDTEVLAMLSNSWIAAREYEAAVDPLERAADLADTGDLYVRLAQVYVQREDWEGATGALRKALAKGGLEDTGNANLLMGIALYSADKPGEARTWFENAGGYDATAQEAEVWISHIDQELAQQEAEAAESAASGG
jgi:tetratricopeptide (TPR) repeat protein